MLDDLLYKLLLVAGDSFHYRNIWVQLTLELCGPIYTHFFISKPYAVSMTTICGTAKDTDDLLLVRVVFVQRVSSPNAHNYSRASGIDKRSVA